MKTILASFFMSMGLFSSAQPFFILDGPDAPDVSLTITNNDFILTLSNPPSSNNYMEYYEEQNPNIPGPTVDSSFKFQGYLVYQIDTASLFQSVYTDQLPFEVVLNDTNIARLVGQSDLADTLTTFVNHIFDSSTMQCNTYIPFPATSNQGTQYAYTVSTDAFTGQPFSPGTSYCFVVLSYAVQISNYDGGCYPDTRPLIHSRKSASGGLPIICADLNNVGVQENKWENISVHPVNGNLIIENHNETKNMVFELFSADGKRVISQETNSSVTTLSCSYIPNGIYFYHLTGNNEFASGKVAIFR